MNELPEPLVSADVDLSDFKFMPLEVARLRRSKMWLLAKRKPEIGFYAINLWAASWHERPAGSLEDDDDVLADLAMCDPKKWEKVRAEVLRGWIKCSDGRIYHEIVAEKANEAWKAKCAQRLRTEAARHTRQKLRSSPTASVTTSVTDTVTISVTDDATDNVTASKYKGQGDISKKEETAAAIEPPTCTHARDDIPDEHVPGPDAHPATRIIAMFDHEMREVWPKSFRNAPASTDFATAQRWLETGVDAAALRWAIRAKFDAMASRNHQPPRGLSYLDGAVNDLISSLNQGKTVARYEAPEATPEPINLPSGARWTFRDPHPKYGPMFDRVYRWRKGGPWFRDVYGDEPGTQWADIDAAKLAAMDADIAVIEAALERHRSQQNQRAA